MADRNRGDARFIVDLEPVGRRAQVEEGQHLLQAAQDAGVEMVSVCGGMGSCDSCRIRVVEGRVSDPTLAEQDALSPEELAEGVRLACQTLPLGDLKVEIPSTSLTTPQRLQIEGKAAAVEIDAPVMAADVQIAPPNLEDLRSDVTRIQSAVEGYSSLRVGHAVLRTLSDRLRALQWSARFALRADEIVGVFPPGTSLLGLAVDVGTTKVAGYLVDLATGKSLAMDGVMNPQIAYGEDVISRIAYANRHTDGQKTLNSRLITTINKLLADLCVRAGTQREQIVEAVVVGNTAMHHFFADLPVRQLGAAPYVPAVSAPLVIPSRDLGLQLAPGAYVYLPANIAGYVGADHVAMILSTGVWETPQTVMAVDIGTNTEITLAAGGRLLSCSCASGPAFEGAHIQDGMRAAPGAIERVQFLDGQFKVQTIGGIPPVGICGSGILDAVAEMISQGLLDERGVLNEDDPRVGQRGDKPAFVLIPAADTGHDRQIVVTRNDVNEIQLAKGAIRAGIDILLGEAGLQPEALDRFIVAGAFGTYIDIGSAITVGMFPELPLERFRQVGNAAGAGARMLLVSSKLRAVVEEIMNEVEYIELTTHPGFQPAFMKRLYF